MENFSSFIKKLERELQNPLPGEEAQFALAPYRKVRSSEFGVRSSTKKAAVLILIYPVNNEPFTVLMLRNSYEGVHSAQVCFPGGGKENNDETLEKTALREAQEEMGIDENKVKIIGKLSQVYIPPSGFLVQPFIGFSEEKSEFNPDKKEVEKVIETPLKTLVDSKTIKTKNIKLSNGFVMNDTPYFDISGNTVWGATAMVLGEFKEILKKIIQ